MRGPSVTHWGQEEDFQAGWGEGPIVFTADIDSCSPSTWTEAAASETSGDSQKWRGKRGLSAALLRSLKVLGDLSPFCLRPSAQSSSPRLPSPRGASDQNTHTWPLPGASWLPHSWSEHREEQAEACHAFCDLVWEIVRHQFCPSHRPSQILA